MQDVVPPVSGNVRRFDARPSGKRPYLVAARPPVVELSWRLPARLRRPVKQELARQRKQRRRQQAIVQFERRPLYDDVLVQPSPAGRRPASQQKAAGYQLKNSAMRMNLPPYVGVFTRQLSTIRSPVRLRPVATVASAPIRQSQRVTKVAPRQVLAATSSTAKRRTSNFPLGERDAPFVWAKEAKPKQKIVAVKQPTSSEAVVIQPKRRFALPLHFSIWPRDTDSGAASVSPVRSQVEQEVAFSATQSPPVFSQSKKKRRKRVLI